MHHIDANEIVTSLPTRIEYLQSFLQFDPETDGNLIHACKPVLGPLVNDIVDAVYDHLLKYDITAAAFAPAQSAQLQSVAVHELHRTSDNIKFRKDFLKGYLVRLAANTDWSPASPFWTYIDGVGKAHTGGVGDQSGLKHRKSKPPLWVDYRDVNLLLGWVENAVLDVVMGVESLDLATRVNVVKALNKYWWIQNDLFARHYITEKGGQELHQNGEEEEQEKTETPQTAAGSGVWGMLGWGK